ALLHRKCSLEISERPLNAMSERRLEVDAVAEIAQEVRDREATRFFDQAADHQSARRIRQLRLRAGEAAERALECGQRRGPSRAAYLPLRPPQIAGFERGREAFVEPRGHAAGGEAAHERVRELVREDPIQFLVVLERA